MNIAILGFGVVGKGVYDIITTHHKHWNIKYILELDESKLGTLIHLKAPSFETIVNDKEIDIIIELIGGKTIAYHFIKEALNHKKHVVTANKAIISEYFHELTTIANENNVSLLFEASVGGAIIVLDPLYTIKETNPIHKIEGIINGSTNFVLSNIFINNKDFKSALEEATNLGYIETGTTDDIDGLDLLRKINILSMISYNTYIKENDVIRVPLTNLTEDFINYVKSQNKQIKYIAISEYKNGNVSIQLEPVVVDEQSIYSKIHFEENIISLHGQYHKTQSFIGQGAGRYPTATAVINDVFLISRNEKRTYTFNNHPTFSNNIKSNYIIEKDNTFTTVFSTTLKSLLEDNSIKCFARMVV
jgi:homoserine dehydrogenase